MRAILCLVLLLVFPAAGADVVHFSRSFGSDRLPTLDKGHLFYLQDHGRVTAYGPNGLQVFDSIVQDPQGRPARINGVAADSDGTIAVTVGYGVPQGYAGGIAMLDASGKQTRFVPTGRYVPVHLCFDKDHFLWAFGWQRDEARNSSEDTSDYMQVRKFSKDGREAGSYLPRSLFRHKLNPFSGAGLWAARASRDRIGAIAYASVYGQEPEWVELDFEGKLIDRWTLGDLPDMGFAFTAAGRLFGKNWAPKSKRPELLEFDLNARARVPVNDVSAAAGDDFDRSMLLGADGNDLVFAASRGSRLVWLKPSP